MDGLANLYETMAGKCHLLLFLPQSCLISQPKLLHHYRGPTSFLSVHRAAAFDEDPVAG
jgi:hypothetical protein